MNRIKDVLEEKGIKQIWLSKKLGKSYNMVNSYAQNRSQPSLEDLYKIANILSVDIALLLKRNMYNLPENNSTLCVEEPQLMMIKKEMKTILNYYQSQMVLKCLGGGRKRRLEMNHTT